MNILQRLNPIRALDSYFKNKAKQAMRGVSNSMEYNPLLTDMKLLSDDALMTKRLTENSVLYSGIETDIRYFYRKIVQNFKRNGIEPSELSYFWYKSDKDFRKIHSGLPQLISEKMVDILIGNGFDIRIESETNEETLNERLDEILVDNNFNSIIQEAIETESWAGGVAFKLSINPLLTEYPIIEIVQPENYTNVVQSGRILKDIFFTYYKVADQRYRLKEIYGVDDEGAYIDYMLERLQADSKTTDHEWVEVNINDIEATQGLKRIDFKGYFNKLSLYKPNKTPNSEFRGSVFGESDYAGSYGEFDAVDEIISTLMQEFRDSTLNKYFPEEFTVKDKSGNVKVKDSFLKDHILYTKGPGENDDGRILYEQGDLRIEKHLESLKNIRETILANVGISPLSLGLSGYESVTSAADSQQERKEVTIRTRDKKIDIWQPFLNKFMKIVMELDMMSQSMIETENGFTAKVDEDFEVISTFNDYIIKSSLDRAEEVEVGLRGLSWDVESAVDYVHEGKTEQEKAIIVRNVKIQNNLPLLEQDTEVEEIEDED